jgi:hypothetical protein
LFVDEFGKGIVAFAAGGVGPQLKTSSCPEKDGIPTPSGKLIVRSSVSVAVLPHPGPVSALNALMLTGKVPTPVVVPEISPVVVFTVSPVGRPAASKLIGPLSAVI